MKLGKIKIFVISLLLVLLVPSTVYARNATIQVWYDCSFSNGTLFPTFYHTSNAVQAWRFDLATMGQSNINYNNFANAFFTTSNDAAFASYQSTANIYSTFDYTIIDGDNRQNNTVDISNAHHAFFYHNSWGVYNLYYILPVNEGANVAFVDGYLVCTSPFYIYSQQSNAAYGNLYYISVQASSGFYMCDIDDFAYLSQESYVCSDLPIYLSSSDGSSGFTTINYDSTNFSFNDSNFNFNYHLTDGFITDPFAPAIDPDDVEVFDENGLNYIYGTVEPQFLSTQDGSIFCTYDFKLNPFMISHAQDYTFTMTYKIKVQTVIGDRSFVYSRTISVGDILINNDQQYNATIPYNYFIDDNMTFDDMLRACWLYGNNSPSSYRDNGVVSYGAGTPGQVRTFGKFTLGINQAFANIMTSAKLYYSCYFTWLGTPETNSGKLSGWKDLVTNTNRTTENTIEKNYYPPSAQVEEQYPTNNNGSGSISYGNGSSVFNDGDVTIVVPNGSNTPFTLSEVSYANVKSMFDDIIDFVDSTSENSFWSVLSRTFGFIPQRIWEYITITIAVICGFAVVRYVLRR